MAAMVQPLRVASRAAQILMASGRPAQASSSSAVALGSAAARSSPTTLMNSFSASSSSSTLRSTSLVLARSGSRRVVTSTADDAVPGRSGLTWAASRALSSTTSIRRPASVVRYLAARSSSSTPMSRPSTPRSRRNLASTSPGRSGTGVAPSRSTYSWPPGNLRRIRWAACTASEVLPSPPAPATTAMRTAPGSPLAPAPDSRSHRRLTCMSWPVKSATSAGSCAGARWGAGGAPGVWGGRGAPPGPGGVAGGRSSPGGRHRAGRDGARRGCAILGQQLGVGADAARRPGRHPAARRWRPGPARRPRVPRRAARTVQGAHQQQPQALAQRMVRQQPADLGDSLVMASRRRVRP